MKFPNQTRVAQDGTHRLIPYRYSDRRKPIINILAEDDSALLRDLTELEGATNDRLLGESGKLAGVSTIELVSGFRLAHIVNASFTHAHPSGGRFNSRERGAWYAGFDRPTSQSEVTYHRTVELQEVGWKEKEISPYIDYLADFQYDFHDIREDSDFADCLDPHSYNASQKLGFALLNSGSAGIVYPSVRHESGTCVACFRPPLVLNVREGPMVTFTFEDSEVTDVAVEDRPHH